MITHQSIINKLNTATDGLLDVAEDMKTIPVLNAVADELIKMAEALSYLTEALPEQPPVEVAPYQIKTGDHVFHSPTEETWVVAALRNNKIIPCGYPLCYALPEDCKLIYKATQEEHTALLNEIAESCDKDDPRTRYALNKLHQMEGSSGVA